jgi:formiminoglutamase
MKHFKFYTKEDILSLTKVRRFETKVGERLQYLKFEGEWPDMLMQSSAKYVLVGIPEDIGVKANHGTGGTATAWLSFLSSFLNNKSNDFMPGDNMMLLGHFDFGDVKFLIDSYAYNPEELVEAYRHAVNIIDEEVEHMLKVIAACNKIPIVIGGGHNNAYPIIKGVAKGLAKNNAIPLAQINCVNLDAHTGYGPTEGRHSGNAFKYAEEDGYLGKYCIIGVHENNISQSELMDMHTNPFIDYISFEEIFIHERKNFIQAIAHATGFTDGGFTGIELAMDCIENVLSSAGTPSGITALQARQYINFAATDAKVAYLHICEGATQLSNGQKDESTGKLIGYLVSDFIKAHAQD